MKVLKGSGRLLVELKRDSDDGMNLLCFPLRMCGGCVCFLVGDSSIFLARNCLDGFV
jgi:hypothetical protein